jgi:hypothetical protein
MKSSLYPDPKPFIPKAVEVLEKISNFVSRCYGK